MLGGILLAENLHRDVLAEIHGQSGIIAIQDRFCAGCHSGHIVGQMHRLTQQTVRELSGDVILEQITVV